MLAGLPDGRCGVLAPTARVLGRTHSGVDGLIRVSFPFAPDIFDRLLDCVKAFDSGHEATTVRHSVGDLALGHPPRLA